jgi:hypothetical protein
LGVILGIFSYVLGVILGISSHSISR